jgi:hypothetical protein
MVTAAVLQEQGPAEACASRAAVPATIAPASHRIQHQSCRSVFFVGASARDAVDRHSSVFLQNWCPWESVEENVEVPRSQGSSSMPSAP